MSNEPVAYLWQHCDTGRSRVVMPDQIITTDATWLVVGPLYLHPVDDTALLRQALSTLEGWANHGDWVWPESALEQAKRNTEEAITALKERLGEKT